MKQFKIERNQVLIEGILYGSKPTELLIKGKSGMIKSISISGKGTYYPICGTFNEKYRYTGIKL